MQSQKQPLQTQLHVLFPDPYRKYESAQHSSLNYSKSFLGYGTLDMRNISNASMEWFSEYKNDEGVAAAPKKSSSCHLLMESSELKPIDGSLLEHQGFDPLVSNFNRNTGLRCQHYPSRKSTIEHNPVEVLGATPDIIQQEISKNRIMSLQKRLRQLNEKDVKWKNVNSDTNLMPSQLSRLNKPDDESSRLGSVYLNGMGREITKEEITRSKSITQGMSSDMMDRVKGWRKRDFAHQPFYGPKACTFTVMEPNPVAISNSSEKALSSRFQVQDSIPNLYVQVKVPRVRLKPFQFYSSSLPPKFFPSNGLHLQCVASRRGRNVAQCSAKTSSGRKSKPEPDLDHASKRSHHPDNCEIKLSTPCSQQPSIINSTRSSMNDPEVPLDNGQFTMIPPIARSRRTPFLVSSVAPVVAAASLRKKAFYRASILRQQRQIFRHGGGLSQEEIQPMDPILRRSNTSSVLTDASSDGISINNSIGNVPIQLCAAESTSLSSVDFLNSDQTFQNSNETSEGRYFSLESLDEFVAHSSTNSEEQSIQYLPISQPFAESNVIRTMPSFPLATSPLSSATSLPAIPIVSCSKSSPSTLQQPFYFSRSWSPFSDTAQPSLDHSESYECFSSAEPPQSLSHNTFSSCSVQKRRKLRQASDDSLETRYQENSPYDTQSLARKLNHEGRTLKTGEMASNISDLGPNPYTTFFGRSRCTVESWLEESATCRRIELGRQERSHSDPLLIKLHGLGSSELNETTSGFNLSRRQHIKLVKLHSQFTDNVQSMLFPTRTYSSNAQPKEWTDEEKNEHSSCTKTDNIDSEDAIKPKSQNTNHSVGWVAKLSPTTNDDTTASGSPATSSNESKEAKQKTHLSGEILYACDEDPETGRPKPIRINVFPVEAMRKRHIMMTYVLLGALSLFTLLSICYDFYTTVIATTTSSARKTVVTQFPRPLAALDCQGSVNLPYERTLSLPHQHVSASSIHNEDSIDLGIPPAVWNTYYSLREKKSFSALLLQFFVHTMELAFRESVCWISNHPRKAVLHVVLLLCCITNFVIFVRHFEAILDESIPLNEGAEEVSAYIARRVCRTVMICCVFWVNVIKRTLGRLTIIMEAVNSRLFN